jgi:hypothetical protein
VAAGHPNGIFSAIKVFTAGKAGGKYAASQEQTVTETIGVTP